MNRHEDDESTGHSSQSSRHSSRLFKYDDITILIGKNFTHFYIFLLSSVGWREIFSFQLQVFLILMRHLRPLPLKHYLEALTGQLYELKCSPTENILSIKGNAYYYREP